MMEISGGVAELGWCGGEQGADGWSPQVSGWDEGGTVRRRVCAEKA
jgi:hypothetical protein